MTTPSSAVGSDIPPLVSVAMCTWNGAAHIDSQLDSILAQRDVRLEVLILDDASTDGVTWPKLEDRAATDPRIRLFRNETNLGHLRSFEKCMGLATSDWIAPADQDDIWAADKLSKLHAAIGTSDLAYCDSVYMDAEGALTGGAVSADFEMFSGTNPVPLFFQNTVSGHACLFRKDLLAVAGPAPDGFFHDWWLALCAAGRHGVVYLDEPLVQFRRHANACTNIGRGDGDRKVARRNRKWLEDLAAVGGAYSTTSLRASAFAGQFAQALQSALAGHSTPALHLAWSHRAELPPEDAPGWLKAIKLWSRIRRKSKRAQREPASA